MCGQVWNFPLAQSSLGSKGFTLWSILDFEDGDPLPGVTVAVGMDSGEVMMTVAARGCQSHCWDAFSDPSVSR